jgi:hypothetical protein
LGTFAQHIDQVFFFNRFLMEQGIGNPIKLLAVLGQQPPNELVTLVEQHLHVLVDARRRGLAVILPLRQLVCSGISRKPI